MTKPTKWPLRPAKTQINLCIRPVWSESSLCAWTNIGSSATQWAHYEDSDQTGRMPRLIRVFAGHKDHSVGFVMRWLTFRKCILIFASGLRNKPHFWRPCSLALWLQSQGSLVRAPALPHTGYTCNLHRISHEILCMVFLLIQERHFLVISESICTLDHFVLVNCLEGLSLSARWSGLGRSFNSSPGFIDRESAIQIYCYMRGIVVTLSRSLMHSGDVFKCTILRSGSQSRPLYDWNTVATFCTVDWKLSVYGRKI